MIMTRTEIRAVNALSLCSFLPGSFDKRIVRLWGEAARERPKRPMSEKGRAFMWRLVWKYRRQILDEELVAAARKKREAAERAHIYRQVRK